MKPLIIIILPKETSLEKGDRVNRGIQTHPATEDYHFMVMKGNSDEIDIRAFFEKDFDQVKFEELKQFLADKLVSQ